MENHGLWKANEILSDRVDKLETKHKILCERSYWMKRFFENKYVFWGLTGIVVLSLVWVSWVTTCIYAKDKQDEVTAGVVKQLGKDIGEVKDGLKILKDDLQEHNDKNERFQQDILKLLIDIKGDTGKKR